MTKYPWVNAFPKIRPMSATCIRPSWLSPKRDGYRLTIIKDDFGFVTALTRTPVDITESIKHLLLPAYKGMPCNTAVFAELWCPGLDSSQIQTAINEKNPGLRWDAFAIAGMEHWTFPEIASISVPNVVDTFIAWEIPHFPLSKVFPDIDDPDVEGWVAKAANLLDMWKWKPELTIDLVVSGFTDGAGKYVGDAGALILSTVDGYEIAKCSGMTDDIRSSIDASWVGKVVEVKYQTVTRYGRLRHPRFVRVREDKPAAECTVHQDRRLLEYWHA
jgi:ATP-dependent DNA ligase